MKKSVLISKYEHKLYAKELDLFFHHCKKELGNSYSMMKRLQASVKFLYEEVLNEDVDFEFNIKRKKNQ